jgi:hypothetical protein
VAQQRPLTQFRAFLGELFGFLAKENGIALWIFHLSWNGDFKHCHFRNFRRFYRPDYGFSEPDRTCRIPPGACENQGQVTVGQNGAIDAAIATWTTMSRCDPDRPV